MAGDDTRGTAFGGALQVIDHHAPGVAALAVRGFLTFAVTTEVLAGSEELLRRDATVTTVVLDVTEIDGFEPGVPYRVIQWLGHHADRVRAGVLVTVSPVLLATVRAAGLMLPTIHCASASTRGEALALATRLAGGRVRATSAVVPSANAALRATTRHNAP